jgi:hypothetical protein
MTALLPFIFELLEWLASSVPKWIAAGRAKGELTAEQEAEYQARQAAIFNKDYMQPDPPA